jgi:uncharacterized protein
LVVKDKPATDERMARALGLKPAALAHLRAGLAAGEDPLWLRCADPALAGALGDAFGFELLLERLRRLESLERRRANVLREHDGEELAEWREHIARAETEADFEDLLIAVQPAPAPPGTVAPEKEAHAEYLAGLRGDVALAVMLRRLFDGASTVAVEAVGEGEEAQRFHALAAPPAPLAALDPADYLRLRRGEKARALRLVFDVPQSELLQLFVAHGGQYPAQEKDAYRELFLRFAREERLPRLALDVRTELKRRAEEHALQEAWTTVAHALDRGQQDGPVLAIAPGRGSRVIAALVTDRDAAPRTQEFELKAENFDEALDRFLDGQKPQVLAFSGEGAARAAGQKITSHLRKSAEQLRSVLVPPGAGRTLLREVARRASDSLLSHDERHAFLLGWLVLDPRAVALHTPHLIRSFIPQRGEMNPRLLEEFETLFLRELLLARGVDANAAPLDALRRVPGLDADGALAERATAPFRSLEDFQARMGLEPRAARAAFCLLRVRGGDDPLDARALHPELRAPLRRAAEAAGVGLAELVREPAKLEELPWDTAMEGVAHAEGVYDRIRDALARGGRRRPSLRRRSAPRRLETLQKGDRLKGVVKSLAEYGAFVDVGTARPGLVHVSHMAADRFVKDPTEVVQIGQEIEVRVLEVDLAEQRMRLSMLTEEQEAEAAQRNAARRNGGREESGAGRGGERGERSGSGGRDGRSERGASRGPRSDRGPRPDRGGGGDRGPRRSKRDEDFGPDPRAKKEEIDPTNPFFQFFKQQKKTDGGK